MGSIMKAKETKEERIAKRSAKQAILVALITSVVGLTAVIVSKFIDSQTNPSDPKANSNAALSRSEQPSFSSQLESRKKPNQSAETETPFKTVPKSQASKKTHDDTSHFDLILHVSQFKNSEVEVFINDILVMSGSPDSKGLLKLRLPMKYQDGGNIIVVIQAASHFPLSRKVKVVPYEKVVNIDFD
jgi:hypothetical protein